ncbi:hypothetical protein BC830DRAFT_1138768 [Chytriomyces sp. MP71]|nr:hypothetical protein BC830DRAFT_1138768 [Chytriomyces sp. MP71]
MLSYQPVNECAHLAVAPADEPTNGSIALVFGWMGGELKHMDKTAAHFVRRGFTTVVVLSEQNALRDAHMKGLRLAHFDPLLALLSARRAVAQTATQCVSKIVVHLSSNGGCLSLRHLVLCLRNRNLVLNSVGVILDSAPSIVVPHSIGKWPDNPYAKQIAQQYQEMNITDFANEPINLSAPFGAFEREGAPGPRLFLFSDGDVMVPASQVSQFVTRARKENLSPVHELMFKGSPHVRHSAVFEKEYWERIDAFLRDTLRLTFIEPPSNSKL